MKINNKIEKYKRFINTKLLYLYMNNHDKFREVFKKFSKQDGQGTTEYAILVGVLVVIAILAIMIFKPKLEELWKAIADGISGL